RWLRRCARCMTRWPSLAGSFPWARVRTAAATIIIRTPWSAAVTASCRSMCTFPVVRRPRKRWCTASCSCRRRLPARARSPDKRAWRGQRLSELDEALALKVDAHLAGSVRHRPALAHELAYETDAGALLAVCRTLRDAPDLRFEMLMDLAGVDYPDYGRDAWRTASATRSGFSRGRVARNDRPDPHAAGRFAAVYHLLSLSNNHRLRLTVTCPDSAT